MIILRSLRNPALALIFLVGGLVNCGQGAASAANSSSRIPALQLFLLEPGYTGPFIAIYGQKNGIEPRWDGDTAVFNVGRSGIVRIAFPEPPHTTLSSHAYAGAPARRLPNYPTCADMRVYVVDKRVGICWLDFAVHMETTPDHIVAVITDWNDIPKNFERTTFVYDSVLFGGKGLGKRAWEEPRDLKRKTADMRQPLSSGRTN